MEMVYAAMLLHKAHKEVNESNVKKVLDAAGVSKSDAEVKSMVSALAEVDIETAIKEASVPVAAPVQAGEVKQEKKEEKKEEKKPEEAAAGLGLLFG